MTTTEATTSVSRRIGGIEFSLARDAGPRIIGASQGSSPDFMAKLAGEGIHHPAIGFYPFIGGHRFWRSPEVPAVTYVPDTAAVTLDEVDGGVRITGQPDGEGIVKAVTITEVDGVAVLAHSLSNEGPASVMAAPWAITQVTTGGTAYLPTPTQPLDPDGLLPNRNLVLWPYTDLSAPEIDISPTMISMEASTRPSKMKLGTANRAGWIAYHLDGYLLVKWTKLHDDRRLYPDMGASIQVFRDERFLEIETVGPLCDIVPGQVVTHREMWKILEVGHQSVEEVLAALPATPIEAES